MSQRWRAVGNTVSDFTGRKFEPKTSRSIYEGATTRPIGRSLLLVWLKIFLFFTFSEFVMYLFLFGNKRVLLLLLYFLRANQTEFYGSNSVNFLIFEIRSSCSNGKLKLRHFQDVVVQRATNKSITTHTKMLSLRL